MIGEIGGTDEETAARWAKEHMKKPVVGFIRRRHGAARASGWATPAPSFPAAKAPRRRSSRSWRNAGSASPATRPRWESCLQSVL
jgi:succinyl-CoA synthetase alpha subunit